MGSSNGEIHGYGKVDIPITVNFLARSAAGRRDGSFRTANAPQVGDLALEMRDRKVIDS